MRPLPQLGVSCGGDLLRLPCGDGMACCAAEGDELPSSVAAGVLPTLPSPLFAWYTQMQIERVYDQSAGRTCRDE